MLDGPVIRLSCPARTVSLAFRCERLLGKPSMHVCSSRLRFGLRGSNSHFQSQNLMSCQLDEARSNCRSGEIRTLTSRIKKPVRYRYATDLKWVVAMRLSWVNMGWEWMELNHLVQDDHRVTAGYLTVRSHSRGSMKMGQNAESPPRFFLGRAPKRAG